MDEERILEYHCDSLNEDEVEDFIDARFFRNMEDRDALDIYEYGPNGEIVTAMGWADDYDWAVIKLLDGSRWGIAYPETLFPVKEGLIENFYELYFKKMMAHEVNHDDERIHRLLVDIDTIDLSHVFCAVCGFVDLMKEPPCPEIEEGLWDVKYKRFIDQLGKRTKRQ